MREQFLCKRGGPAQLRRLFQLITKHDGMIRKEALAETMLAMGMSMSQLDAVYGTLISRVSMHVRCDSDMCACSGVRRNAA